MWRGEESSPGDGGSKARSFGSLARTLISLASWTRPSSPADAAREPLTNGIEHFTDPPLELPLARCRQHADIVAAVFYCFVLAGFAVVVIGSSFLSVLSDANLTAILCSCNVAMYIFTGILQHHLEAQVRKERRQGFIDFSQKLEMLIELPCSLIAIGTSILLLVLSWQRYMVIASISPFLVVRCILAMEVVWIAALVGLYIWAVRSHDLSQLDPDIMQFLYSVLQPPTPLGDLRYIDGASLTDQQALLLRYQQENLVFLSEEILRLQETLGKYESSQDGTTPQVDLAHLLGAREQELRAVTAERDQLQAEIRLARSFIAEKDSDILRIKTVNDKYVEENERLRVMLDEWSSRTAKLELALEKERLSNADLRRKVLEFSHNNNNNTL